MANKDGQWLLVPEVEVDTYRTSLEGEMHVKNVFINAIDGLKHHIPH